MKKLTFITSSFFIFIISISFSQTPKYYLKKGTWIETLIGSREELAKEEKNNTDKFTPALGPWYITGPWTSEAGKSFEQKFPPEDNADISVQYGGHTWEPKPDWKDGIVISLPNTSN